MSAEGKRVCYICRRVQPLAKMDGRRCADREACLKIALAASPPVLTKKAQRTMTQLDAP